MGYLYRLLGNMDVEETEKTKTTIVYYSSTGTNYQMAQWASEAAKAAGSEVRLVKVPETASQAVIDSTPGWKVHMEATKDIPVATGADLEWADALIFSVPTRFGNIASQMQSFIDTLGGLWFKGKLSNKAVSAMTSAQNIHGGQEATILSLYTTMYHWGAIVAAPGYTDAVVGEANGNPYGTSATVSSEGRITDDIPALKAAVQYQAKRTLSVGQALKVLNA